MEHSLFTKPSLRGFTALLAMVLMLVSGLAPVMSAGAADAGPTAVEVMANDDMGTEPLTNGVTKDMVHFLHYVDDTETSRTIIDKSTWYYMDTTREWSSSPASFRVSAAQQVMKWYMYPVLAEDFHVGSFDLIIWAQRIAGAGHPNKVVRIYEKNETGEYLIHTKNHGAGPGIVAAPTEQTWGSDAAWTGHTFGKGSSILVTLDVNPGAGNTFDFIFDTAAMDSRVEFSSNDSMDIDSCYIMDSVDAVRSDLDPRVADKDIRFRANLTDQFGGYDIDSVTVTVTAPDMTVLVNAAPMTKVIGSPKSWLSVYQYEWNYSGQAAGTYQVQIWAVDNNGDRYRYYDGNADFGDYDVTFDWQFNIGEVKYLNVKVVDSKGIPLAGALVQTILNGSKILEGQNITNSSGMANITLFTALYEVRAMWGGTVVNMTVLDLVADVKETAPLMLNASVYYPNFRFYDGRTLSLENATVNLVAPNMTTVGPFKTNSTGEFGLDQVPGGWYRALTRWRDVQVNDTWLLVDGNTNYTVNAAVHYMKVIARDDLGGVLPGAQIVIANNTTTIVFDSKVTDLSGSIESRLPAGQYDVSIYWQNARVFDRENVSFHADMTIDAFTGIFVLNITALDGHLVPVPRTRVLVMTTTSQSVVESNFTDDDGVVVSRLPRGIHIIKAYWKDVIVNETAVDLDDNHDIALALDIYYPVIRVIDDEGRSLSDARVDVYFSGTDKLFGSGLTDGTGDIGFRVPATVYDIRVTWRDRTVNITNTVVLDSDDVLVMTALVFNMAITVEDPHGIPVEDALVIVTFDNGASAGAVSTNNNGTVWLRLPYGTFDIDVEWHGVTVATRDDLDLSGKRDVLLTASIWYVDALPVDSRLAALEDALVSVRFSGSDDVLASGSTGSGGATEFRVPSSTYDIDVVWRDHVVHEATGLVFDQDLDLEMACDVFYLGLGIVDSKDMDVLGAMLTVTEEATGKEAASGTTVIGAGFEARLPRDIYSIDARWQGVTVNETAGMMLDADKELVLQAWVYYLHLQLVDSRDVPVGDAVVTISLSSTGEPLATADTDDDGDVLFRLPGRVPLNISARWNGVEVLFIEDHNVTSDATEVRGVHVFYVDMTLVDSRNVPVRDSPVVLALSADDDVMGSEITDDGGSIHFRVPGELYSITAVWWGVQVLDMELDVAGDKDTTRVVDVSYMTMSLMDTKDVPVVGAQVNLLLVSTGISFGAGVTDGNGTVVARLPHEFYAITAYWEGVRIASVPPVEFDGNTGLDVPVWVHYLDIVAVDDRGLGLEDALVTLSLEENTSLETVLKTDGSGMATARIPRGDYIASAAWEGVTVADGLGVNVVEDGAFQINARVFYLTVQCKDKGGAGLKGVRVLVEDGEGATAGQSSTDGSGVAEFRLPIGDYTVKARYVTTHMMNEIDAVKDAEVQLTSSQELSMKFSEYPPEVYMTNMFLVSMFSIILIVLTMAVVALGTMKRKRRLARDVEGEDEYPPKAEQEEGWVDIDKKEDTIGEGNDEDRDEEEEEEEEEDVGDEPEPGSSMEGSEAEPEDMDAEEKEVVA